MQDALDRYTAMCKECDLAMLPPQPRTREEAIRLAAQGGATSLWQVTEPESTDRLSGSESSPD